MESISYLHLSVSELLHLDIYNIAVFKMFNLQPEAGYPLPPPCSATSLLVSNSLGRRRWNHVACSLLPFSPLSEHCLLGGKKREGGRGKTSQFTEWACTLSRGPTVVVLTRQWAHGHGRPHSQPLWHSLTLTAPHKRWALLPADPQLEDSGNISLTTVLCLPPESSGSKKTAALNSQVHGQWGHRQCLSSIHT